MPNKSKSNVIIMKKEYLYFIDLVKMTPIDFSYACKNTCTTSAEKFVRQAYLLNKYAYL